MTINEIAITDEQYPKQLLHVVEPPQKLYARGELLASDELSVAIVGARKCTPYGKQVAYDLARDLAQAGVVVVSGMALGIDGEAHKGALDGGGRTLAVLGTGVDDDSLYPASHVPLARRIIQQGAVLSEFAPATPSLPHHFPQRNRIIAGLARATIVVEADERSGSLITAGFALEQGKDVFAIPGPIYSRMSRGTHKLLREGARFATSARDILEDLEITPAVRKEKTSAATAEEQLVLDAIAQGAAETDAIIAALDIPAHAVLSLLATMELKQKIQLVGANTYAIKE